MTEITLIIFLLCLVTQVCFHHLVFRKIISPSSKKETSKSLSVSIIIAARDEATNLPALLKALSRQDYAQLEIIIINDRSTDSTEEILKEYTSNYKNFNHITIKTLPAGWNGKKYALKTGVEMAQNDILLFTDADCNPKSDQWVKSIMNEFSNETDIVLGFSPYNKTESYLNHFIQFETLLTGFQYLGLAKTGYPYMGVGRNLAIRKRVYDIGFLKSIAHLMGGDDDLMINHLSTKRNTAIAISPMSQTLSIPENTWSGYFKQKIRHLSVGSHYHVKYKTLLGLFMFSFVIGWILFFALLMSTINPYWILTAFAIRSLSFYSIFARIGRKLDVPFRFWLLPLLDLSYSIYYPVVGLRAVSTKSIKWK